MHVAGVILYGWDYLELRSSVGCISDNDVHAQAVQVLLFVSPFTPCCEHTS